MQDYAEVYGQLYIPLVKYAAAVCGNVHMAEELVQEAFLKLLPRQDVLDLELPAIRAYVKRTIRNLFVDRVRSTSREVLTEEVPEGSGAAEGQDNAESAYLTAEWEMLLAMLPERDRQLLILRHILGYNSREIAREMEIPPETVRTALVAARKRLKALLSEA